MKTYIHRNRLAAAVDTLSPTVRYGIEQWLTENPNEPIIRVCDLWSVNSWTVAEIIWQRRDTQEHQ